MSGESSTTNLGLTAEGLVMIGSEDMPAGTPVVKGPNFNEISSNSLEALLSSYSTIGFQATNLSLAIEEVNKMLKWRLLDEPIGIAEDDDWKDPEVRKRTKCTIWLSMTSNMISSGVREIILYLCQHKLIDVIVTSAGGVEEDFMKILRPHYVGSFDLIGSKLRMKGLNRIGNLVVPNLNYVDFEEWFMPILDEMHDDQEKRNIIYTPSMMIKKMGERINNPASVWYWAAKNDIPVFCPGITDGSIGDMIYFHLWKRSGFIVDIGADVRKINDIAVKAKKSGIIILGGGTPKHHVCNANLMRNGADYAVFINTGSDYDGSDSGARPDEAVSWGKIKLTATPVKIYGDAALVFPLLVSQTFVKEVERRKSASN
jgi:deoxyhypusine synthase